MKIKVLSLRLPQRVAKELQKRAKAQNRSINSQIVHDVERANGYNPANTVSTANSSAYSVTLSE